LVRKLLIGKDAVQSGKKSPPLAGQLSRKTSFVGEENPMTLTLSDTLSSATTANGTGTDTHSLGLNSEAPATLEGPSFGQLLSDLHAQPFEAASPSLGEMSDTTGLADGQQLADPMALASDSLTAPPALSLKEINLGPNLSVITPETAAPDTQSLEAFARAQGLDEKAVTWLFGKPDQATKTSMAVTPSTIGRPTNQPSHMAATAPANLANATAASTADPFAATPAQPNAPSGHANTTNTANTSALQTAAQALWAMADVSSADKKAGTSSASAAGSTEDGIPINLLRMPPPAAIWMQRSMMNSVLPDNAAAQKGPHISKSELDLGADWDPDTLSSLLGKDSAGTHSAGTSATGTHSSAYANFAARWDAQATSRSDTGQASSGAPADPSSAAARSENIQNLADKMGQAVGQRILSEMEKGQWHLKLQLRPATLGHIEVEMRMRSGEFDAIFIAPNATTRDLLQDGMAKLKETLAQMGMDVANIHVGNGQTGQSGGDSTPRSPQNTPSSAGASAEETASDTHSRAPLVKTPKEGLDVLV
jgi:flagellar hook-length control protein FliK